MMVIVGGAYRERCLRPEWDQLFGSGGRAAAALAPRLPGSLKFITYADAEASQKLEARGKASGFAVEVTEIEQTLGFDYFHPLSTPIIVPPPQKLTKQPLLNVEGNVVLRFGMMEGDAKVSAKKAVYDPQSANEPFLFTQNGSTADELAVVLNLHEAQLLVGQCSPQETAQRLMERDGAKVVVLKGGPQGPLVFERGKPDASFPAFQTSTVFKIGSGDIFAAAFAYFWAIRELPAERSAALASKATANYCQTRITTILEENDLDSLPFAEAHFRRKKVYLAGPFFDLGQRWVIEEALMHLREMGLDVFSPLHDVGQGPAEEVAKEDLKGLDSSDCVLAVVDGADPGTLVEIGYAIAKGKPVIAYGERISTEDAKMIEGTGCVRVSDLASAIYQAAWL